MPAKSEGQPGKTILCGRLIDGTGRAPVDGAVVRLDAAGRITAVLTGAREVAAASASTGEVIDWSSYTVIPGLVDAHNHLGMNSGGDMLAMATEPDVRKVIRAAANARVDLESGITTLRVCGEKAQVDLEWRAAAADGLFFAPRLVVSGEFICPTSGHAAFYGANCDGPEEVRRGVRRQIAAGADFIKVMVSGGAQEAPPGPMDPEYTPDELRAAIDEAHRGHRRVAGHCFGGPGADVAIEAGIDSIEHGTHLTGEQLARMAAKGIGLVVTAGVFMVEAELPSPTPAERALTVGFRDRYPEVIAQAKRAGVPLAVGGDFLHGRLDLEVEMLVKGGLTPMEALLAATSSGAAALGLSKEIGSIVPGKQGDLVALGGDPLASWAALRDVRGVIQRGVPRA